MTEDTNISTPPQPPLVIPCVSRCPSINFFNVDCIEFMKSKPDKCYDLAIVDPPYGIGANKMTLGNGKRKIYRGVDNWDNAIPTAEYFEQLFRVSKNQIVWGGNYMTEFLPPMSSWIFWDKGTGENDFADGELAWSSIGGALRKCTKSWVGANAKDEAERIHPTQKPVYLYRWILNKFAKPEFKILDTHGGGMGIAIACDTEGFDLDICEIDTKYFNDGIKRYETFKRQQRLF
jgi:site-specific DNA-methyltransferase (adenine-specific)